jgi:hypothetical protein
MSCWLKNRQTLPGDQRHFAAKATFDIACPQRSFSENSSPLPFRKLWGRTKRHPNLADSPIDLRFDAMSGAGAEAKVEAGGADAMMTLGPLEELHVRRILERTNSRLRQRRFQGSCRRRYNGSEKTGDWNRCGYGRKTWQQKHPEIPRLQIGSATVTIRTTSGGSPERC